MLCSFLSSPEAIGCNGDPHLVGFRGQKFDFTGEDGLWYALVSDGPCHQTNIRITAPVPESPEITYITGVALLLCDAESNRHTVEITVEKPHSLDSSCPEQEKGNCLADGALKVVLDGEEMTQPGQVCGDYTSMTLVLWHRICGFVRQFDTPPLPLLR